MNMYIADRTCCAYRLWTNLPETL